MKTQAMVGVAVLAVGTAVALVTSGIGNRARLPMPQAGLGDHAPGSSGSPASAGHASTDSTLPSGADPTHGAPDTGSDPSVYLTSPLVLGGCTVSVSNPAPLQGQTAETVTVSTTAGAEVRLEADYLHTRSVHSGLADGSGSASFSLGIAHAEPGVTVRVTAGVSLRGVKDSCSTSFTPVAATGIAPTAGGG